MYVNGHWGAICGDDFSDLEADAVCHSLGFDKASEVHHSATELYNSWPDRVFLENFDCFECAYWYGGCYSMSDCDYDSLVDYSCSSYDYVGVECYVDDIFLDGFFDGKWLLSSALVERLINSVSFIILEIEL